MGNIYIYTVRHYPWRDFICLSMCLATNYLSNQLAINFTWESNLTWVCIVCFLLSFADFLYWLLFRVPLFYFFGLQSSPQVWLLSSTYIDLQNLLNHEELSDMPVINTSWSTALIYLSRFMIPCSSGLWRFPQLSQKLSHAFQKMMFTFYHAFRVHCAGNVSSDRNSNVV